jgi:uncharacterized protein YlxW (UPF0749 family)
VRWRSSVVLAAVTALLGFLLVTAGFSARQAQRLAAPGKSQLLHVIDQRRSQEADLEQAVRLLRQQVATAQARAAVNSRAERDEANREAQLAIDAGTTAMRGGAVTVKLSDSTRQPQSATDASAYRIHDSDLQLVVNALLAAGAEAVAVNDNRIVSTSPIRDAGGTIIVNFRPLTPPYRVVGLGADRSAFEASDVAGRFRLWTSQYGLGFAVSTGTETVPAYAGRVAISSAEPVPPVGASTTVPVGGSTTVPVGGSTTAPAPTAGVR